MASVVLWGLFTLWFANAVDSSSCLNCHAPDMFDMAPVIHGQNSQYIEKQLFDFKADRRASPRMKRVVEGLSAADLKALATHFGNHAWQKPADEIADLALVAEGKRLATAHRCATCHGEKFLGFEHVPRIRGQDAEYLEMQLRNFRDRRRTNDNGLMFAVVQSFSDDEIRALAAFVSSQEQNE